MTTNILVYDARDHEGSMLATLVRECDTTGSFQFLSVADSSETARRAYEFLAQQGVAETDVSLPFIIAVAPVSSSSVQRSVVHGHAMTEWITGLISTVVQGGMSRERVRNNVVARHIRPQTAHLIAYAMTPGENSAPVEQSAAVGMAAAVATGTVPVDAVIHDGEDDDTLVVTESHKGAPSATPTSVVPMRRPENTVNISEVMAQSKMRENMNKKYMKDR